MTVVGTGPDEARLRGRALRCIPAQLLRQLRLRGGGAAGLLGTRHVDSSVVVVGVSLNVGIPNTAMDLMNHGFEVIVARDAVAGIPEEYGEMVIEHTLKMVATVTTTDALIEAWARPTR